MVYILIDLEESPKDAVYGVYSTREKAEEAKRQLEAMSVYGGSTKILEEEVD